MRRFLRQIHAVPLFRPSSLAFLAFVATAAPEGPTTSGTLPRKKAPNHVNAVSLDRLAVNVDGWVTDMLRM